MQFTIYLGTHTLIPNRRLRQRCWAKV